MYLINCSRLMTKACPQAAVETSKPASRTVTSGGNRLKLQIDIFAKVVFLNSREPAHSPWSSRIEAWPSDRHHSSVIPDNNILKGGVGRASWPAFVCRVGRPGGLPHRLHCGEGSTMPTIQVVLDAKLLTAADHAAKRRKANRSALIREALREYLKRLRELELEERDRRGYLAQPQREEEFRIWEDAAAWPEL